MRLGCTAALAALVLGSSAHAQGRLTGFVRDTVGAPLAGVEVTVQGVSRPATTSQRGSFEFRDVKPGVVSVTVRRLGYAPQTTIARIANGDNTLPDFVLTAVARELDTVETREQQLWRERPLLREMEENRKIGLGQFITRAELAKNQGGFLSPMFSQKRGLVVVRHKSLPHTLWLANKYVPKVGGCVELEDDENDPVGKGLTPQGANCDYCFPAIYLDYTRLSSGKTVPNLANYNPDQLEAIEVYLGAAETPMRYSGGFSGCGVVVLHTRAIDSKPRVIAAKQDTPTRSRLFANASVSAGAQCFQCNTGGGGDVSLGYTLRDRWVIAGRYASWTNDDLGAQSMKLHQVLAEWYPRRDPGRFKWFVNAGLGFMSVDMDVTRDPDTKDHYDGSSLPSTVLGTGVDIAVVRRLAVTPFYSMSRTISARAGRTRCVNELQTDGSRVMQCLGPISEPGTYNLKQLGVRLGWR